MPTTFFGWVLFLMDKYGSVLLKGAGVTLLLAVVGTFIGCLIGLVVGVIQTIPMEDNDSAAKKFAIRCLQRLLDAYVEVFRGTPMIVQAMVVYYGAMSLFNIDMSPMFAGFFVVSINTGAYMAEIVRGGIISVSKGQFEGAHAIGMTHAQTMFYVVIPQVLRNILPSVANEFVINIKDTSVLNVIGFTELYFVAYTINSINYQTFATYLLVAIIYFVLTFTITRILRLIEKKMDGKKNYTVQGSQNMDADSILREQTAAGGNGND